MSQYLVTHEMTKINVKNYSSNNFSISSADSTVHFHNMRRGYSIRASYIFLTKQRKTTDLWAVGGTWRGSHTKYAQINMGGQNKNMITIK